MNYITTKNVFLAGETRPEGTVLEINDEAVAQRLLDKGSIKPLDGDTTTQPTVEAPVEPVVELPVTTPTPEQVQQDFQDTGAITSPSDPLQQ